MGSRNNPVILSSRQKLIFAAMMGSPVALLHTADIHDWLRAHGKPLDIRSVSANLGRLRVLGVVGRHFIWHGRPLVPDYRFNAGWRGTTLIQPRKTLWYAKDRAYEVGRKKLLDKLASEQDWNQE